MDSTTPVIVGVGQLKQRPDNPLDAVEPLAMMAEVLRAAEVDAGADSLLAGASDIWVVDGAWPYPDPGAMLAAQFGSSARTARSSPGGNSPQMLANEAARRIAAGDAHTVAIVGAEGIWSRRRARRAGERIPYTDGNELPAATRIGAELHMNNDVERERGFEAPIVLYPMFESAVAHQRGETIEQQRAALGELWAGFNAVAVDNPYAWVRQPLTAAEIVEPSAGNRMVGFPYTKAMNSNWDLDLAAGFIMCSAQVAADAGVPRDRWVFPWAGTDGADTNFVSNRDNLHSSPAIRTAGRALFDMAGVRPDDVAHFDLYSCFPSAVQVAADELGIGLDRQLTQTGGLTFAGGPLNNYVSHGIAAMVGTLRSDPTSVGLCTANGGYITKHALGLYSCQPPAAGFRSADCQAEIDQFPRRNLDADYVGDATVEAYTVLWSADGPEKGLLAVRTPDDARQWATTASVEAMEALMAADRIGDPVSVEPDFSAHL